MRHFMRTMVSCCALVMGLVATGQYSVAQVAGPETEADRTLFREIHTVEAGNSSNKARKAAIDSLPLQNLSPEDRAQVQSVLKNIGLFRRLPVLQFEAERRVTEHLVKNPDVAISTWRALEISQFRLTPLRTDVYHADAGDGSVGVTRILQSNPDDILFICDGEFRSPVVSRAITARAIMRFQTTWTQDNGGRVFATQRGDVFVEFPSQGVETIARMISPISHSIADRNFRQVALYSHMMSQAVVRYPGWVEGLVERMDGITPRQKDEFLRACAATYLGACRRQAQQEDKVLTLDEVVAPFRVTNTSAQKVK